MEFAVKKKKKKNMENFPKVTMNIFVAEKKKEFTAHRCKLLYRNLHKSENNVAAICCVMSFSNEKRIHLC